MKAMRKGFTLVELMVVIVIIGILAALAIPRFLGATNKTKATEFKPVLKQIYTLEEAYRQERPDGAYGTFTQIGWDAPSAAEPYFNYAPDGATPGASVTDQTAALTATAPTAPAANATAPVRVAIAGPNRNGVNIKAAVSGNPNLQATDLGCVNSNGGIFVTTAALASLSGASAPLATSATACN